MYDVQVQVGRMNATFESEDSGSVGIEDVINRAIGVAAITIDGVQISSTVDGTITVHVAFRAGAESTRTLGPFQQGTVTITRQGD